jgi:hypothetical protein
MALGQPIQEYPDPVLFMYGSLFCGADAFWAIWPNGKCIFSCDKSNSPGLVVNQSPTKDDHQCFDRVCWKRVLQTRLDLLVVRQVEECQLQDRWMQRNIGPK